MDSDRRETTSELRFRRSLLLFSNDNLFPDYRRQRRRPGGPHEAQRSVGAERPAEPNSGRRPPQRTRPGASGSEHKRAFSPPAAPAPKAGRRSPFRAAAVQAAAMLCPAPVETPQLATGQQFA